MEAKLKSKLVWFPYRCTLKTGAKTIYYLLDENGKIIQPRFTERSRTGAHGLDWYLKEDVDRAVVILKVEVSNRGNHYCTIVFDKKFHELDAVRKAKVIKTILEIHTCPAVLQQLRDFL